MAAISLPNFGHWRVRLSLLFGGRMPRTRSLDYHWYDTPNIHLCTIADFVELARVCGAKIEKANALDAGGRVAPDARQRRAVVRLRGAAPAAARLVVGFVARLAVIGFVTRLGITGLDKIKHALGLLFSVLQWL